MPSFPLHTPLKSCWSFFRSLECPALSRLRPLAHAFPSFWSVPSLFSLSLGLTWFLWAAFSSSQVKWGLCLVCLLLYHVLYHLAFNICSNMLNCWFNFLSLSLDHKAMKARTSVLGLTPYPQFLALYLIHNRKELNVLHEWVNECLLIKREYW